MFKASIVSLSEEIYYTDEPSSSDTSVIKPLTVIRTGDLSRTTEVRISTSDDTAIGGVDYKPRTEILKFHPGVSALDFEVEILYDSHRETNENFKVTLGPQEPISGIFGKVKTAMVVIRENSNFNNHSNKNSNKMSEINDLFRVPYLDSLVYYVFNSTEVEKEQKHLVPSGEPLLCLHVSFLKLFKKLVLFNCQVSFQLINYNSF